MNKYDYLIQALKAKAYIHKEWILSAFAVTRNGLPQNNNASITQSNAGMNGIKETSDYPYRLYINSSDPTKLYFLNPEINALAVIDDSNRKVPLLDYREMVTLPGNTLPNQSEKIEARLGIVLCNAIVLCYPFEGIIPFINDKFNGKIDDIVASYVDPTPENKLQQRDPSKIYVEHILRYHEALGLIEGLTQICTPSLTPKALLPNKELRSLRDKLVKEHGDNLHDPTVVASIKKQLENFDKDSLKNDRSSGLYISDSYYTVQRMKSLNFYGEESAFVGQGEKLPVIIQSLDEGLDLNQYPVLIDSVRSGSYARGALTALGGAKVKYLSRIFQNSRIEEDDCGSTQGMYWEVNKYTINQLVNRYEIGKDKKPYLITKDYITSKMNSKVYVRTPIFCETASPSYCAKCLDKNLATRPDGLFMAPTSQASVMMNDAMKAMHGRETIAIPFDIKLAFSIAK